MKDDLEQLCNLLRLKHIPNIFDREIEQANRDAPSYSDFLARLLRQ